MNENLPGNIICNRERTKHLLSKIMNKVNMSLTNKKNK